MSQVERRFLRAVRDALDRGIPASTIPATCEPLVKALETCGAVERRGVGRGEVLRVQSGEAFVRFVSRRFPLGLEDAEEVPADRVSGVRLRGDAKAAVRGRCEGVFLRSHKPGTKFETDSGRPLLVEEWSSIGGVAAVTLDGSRRWRFAGTVAIIENAEPFWQYERELPHVDLAIYAAGRLSERVLSWLGSDDMASCQLVHWGDYDPIGCMEFIRLVGRCGRRAAVHAPQRIEELLPVYGKPSLISDQIDTLAALRHLEIPREVTRLVELFDRHGRGLEQEALLF